MSEKYIPRASIAIDISGKYLQLSEVSEAVGRGATHRYSPIAWFPEPFVWAFSAHTDGNDYC